MNRRSVALGSGMLAVATGVWVICLAAQDVTPSARPDPQRELCRGALASILVDKNAAPFARLTEHCVIPKAAFRTLEAQVLRKVGEADQALGRKVAFDLVREDRVGNFARRFIWVMRRQRSAVRWTFEFYRPAPDQKWQLTGLSWDPGLKPLYRPAEGDG